MEDNSTKDDCYKNERVVPEQTTAGLIQEISINEGEIKTVIQQIYYFCFSLVVISVFASGIDF